MTSPVSVGNSLRHFYAERFARIREGFAATGDGRAAVQQRTSLLDDIVRRLWKDVIAPEADGPANFTLVALGGFGRAQLFPYSDVDLLFLHAGRNG